jgi:hypothetical protein
MSGDRIARALARIEAAASRIERTAPSVVAPDLELARKYESLHSEAAHALAEIDHLIATLKR